MVTVVEPSPAESGRLTSLIDCDVHNGLRTPDALKPYLARRWHSRYDHRLTTVGQGGVTLGARPHPHIFRGDTFPPEGGPPGSSLALLREQLLDPYRVERAILSPLEILTWVQHGDLGAALSEALNEWLIGEWLEHDHRLYASVCLTTEDPVHGAAEIERRSSDPRFVQVMMLAGMREPLGHPKYWPIYEVAAAASLPVAVHVGGFGGPLSVAGWPTYYVERFCDWPHVYQTHVATLVYSGVFDRFPSLRFVLEEGGLAWMPAFMWRMDRAWQAMREDLPALERAPSEIIRERFWFTTQPVDEPETPAYMTQMFEDLAMDTHVMFATDYPHWDFDPPDRVLRGGVSNDLREKIYADNARALYRFEDRG